MPTDCTTGGVSCVVAYSMTSQKGIIASQELCCSCIKYSTGRIDKMFQIVIYVFGMTSNM